MTLKSTKLYPKKHLLVNFNLLFFLVMWILISNCIFMRNLYYQNSRMFQKSEQTNLEIYQEKNDILHYYNIHQYDFLSQPCIKVKDSI
ncbi:MAG: hypothetical protein ACFFBK_06400, partial [Promethearchaeota archaeon]